MLQQAMGSLRGRIITAGLLIILGIGVVWLATGTYFLNRYQWCFEVERLANEVHIELLQARQAEQGALLHDVNESVFYSSGSAAHIKEHEKIIARAQDDIRQLDALLENKQGQSVTELGQAQQQYIQAFNSLISTYRQRGIGDWGVAGRSLRALNDLEKRVLSTNDPRLKSELLLLQRDEKEYLLRGSAQYLNKVRNDIARLRAISAQSPQAGSLLSALNSYESNFDEYVKQQERIGVDDTKGLQGELQNAVQRIESVLDTLAKQAVDQSRDARRQLLLANILVLLSGIALGSIVFSRMAVSLTDKVGVATHTLAASTSQILASTTQVAASASETAAAVTETTATVEEVKQTAHLSNQKARDVSENAQRSAQISLSGTHSVGETIAGMERVREQMTHIAESVINLSEQSHAIGDIINTVNDLAEQSNLLAVNAAIEAAKAGEQGKGFAVVAQEVKTLAQQSKQATTQVRTLLNEIQKATGAAVMATEQGTKAVEAGLSQAEDAGQAIDGLSRSIDNAAQAAMQIAASSQEQLIGVDQVALAMSSIKDASAQNATSMRQLETAARDLHEVGQSLQQLIGKYQQR